MHVRSGFAGSPAFDPVHETSGGGFTERHPPPHPHRTALRPSKPPATIQGVNVANPLTNQEVAILLDK